MLLEQEVDPEVIRMIKQDIRRTFPKQIEFKGYTMYVLLPVTRISFPELTPKAHVLR